jgi:hypothetical protein
MEKVQNTVLLRKSLLMTGIEPGQFSLQNFTALRKLM